jgi:hypothetical protein
MTAALPFTKANVKRRIEAAREAGLFVVGIDAAGTVLTSDAAVDRRLAPSDHSTVNYNDVEVKR